MGKSAHWARLAERGSYWGLALTFSIYRVLGRAIARLLLFPITIWFFITGAKARRASHDFLNRIHRAGALAEPPTIIDAFRHFYSFAETALDEVEAWTGRIAAERIDFPNQYELEQLARSGRGALFITAHLGNIELARAIGTNAGWKKINAIVYTEHAQKFNSLLNKMHPQSALKLIHISSFGVDTAIYLKEKIDAGEWVFIVGDRTPVSSDGRVVMADFLGSPAPFAIGPYMLAHLMACKVYLIFCVRKKEGFHIYLEPFIAEKIELHCRGRDKPLSRNGRLSMPSGWLITR